MNHTVLFHTCLVNEFAPEVGIAVVTVLERLGFSVDIPVDQTCCGQPAFNSGFRDAARVAARHAIAQLEHTSGPIVIPSGSCGDMVKHQYVELFADDEGWRARAEAVAGRCVEFSAFVAGHIAGLQPLELATSVTYHPSCHLLRGLGVDREPRAILGAVDKLQTCAMMAADECCGFGGLFSMKHADISARMRERKLDDVIASGAARLVSCDMGCLMHLERGLATRGTAVKVQHLAELLVEALR